MHGMPCRKVPREMHTCLLLVLFECMPEYVMVLGLPMKKFN